MARKARYTSLAWVSQIHPLPPSPTPPGPSQPHRPHPQRGKCRVLRGQAIAGGAPCRDGQEGVVGRSGEGTPSCAFKPAFLLTPAIMPLWCARTWPTIFPPNVSRIAFLAAPMPLASTRLAAL